MAGLYPFSNRTAELLRAMPEPGGTHNWLPRVAAGLRHLLDADTCFRFLRRCCDEGVTHRVIPDSEIEDAVDFAYSGQHVAKGNFGRGPVNWPEPNRPLISRVLAGSAPAFDPDANTNLGPADVLPCLFRPGELICAGRTKERALIRPVEDTIPDAGWFQFIVINPMRGKESVNYSGKPSARCQNNTATRRHLVAEFDDLTMSKAQQAQIIGKLAEFAPLVLAVDSGGKSLHAWFRVDHMPARDQARFFYVACLLGADKSRWDICGWLRMPGGLRVIEGVPTIRQRILHFNPATAHA